MKKIAITGPESTGKSTLAADLAAHFQCPWVPEYAREYLANLGRDYDASDVVAIAKGQVAAEEAAMRQHKAPFLFCDTDLLVCKIWQEFKYGFCDSWIEQQFQTRVYDLVLLCDIDMPWVYDPLREHPEARQRLFDLYLNTLQAYQKPYKIVHGTPEARLQQALALLL